MRGNTTYGMLCAALALVGCAEPQDPGDPEAPDPGAWAGEADSVTALPAEFREDRIYLRPVTDGGDTLRFYTDTGGGANMLYEPALQRIGGAQERIGFGPDSATVTPWPEWRHDAAIPEPVAEVDPLDGRLLVVPFDDEAASLHDPGDAGFLGRVWFAERVWTFDYPGRRLLHRPAGGLPTHSPDQRVPLGFQADAEGRRTTHFPRIGFVVAGDSLQALFDTGASMRLTDAALAELGDGRSALRASSFISAEVFDAWREAYPDWRVIEGATALDADIIEVPEIEVAGRTVGPVWFERRPVGAFEEYMSQWMDQPIVGALGGNGLRWFRVSVDYPNAVAVFELPD